MLVKNKLNSIGILISNALSDVEISHEEFIMILDEKDRYERIKHKIINENENYIYFKPCVYLCITMESYCLNCRKYTENKIHKFLVLVMVN